MCYRNPASTGMNWIRQDKRLAIYLRDGLACVWCDKSIECGAKLTLDHVIPASKGGSNLESNLITCCSKCNKVRQDTDPDLFAMAMVFSGCKTTVRKMMRKIAKRTATDLTPFRREAKLLIRRRGSAAKALATM